MSAYSRIRYAIVLFVLLALQIACRNGPTEPTTIVNPALREIRIDAATLRPFGVLIVYAVPVDPKFTLGSHERIPISVRTGAGDSETVLLKSEYCRTSQGAEYQCDVFNVGLQGVGHAEQLQPYLDRIPARYTRTFSDGRAAVIRILDGSLEDAMQRAEKWPGVRWVERSSVGHIAGGPPRQTANALDGALAFDEAGPSPRDQRVQARVGEQISIEYRQPDGSALTFTEVFSGRNPPGSI